MTQRKRAAPQIDYSLKPFVSRDAACQIMIEPGGFGQGSFLEADYVITAWHVAKPGERVKVVNANGEESYGTPVVWNKKYDLAIVRLERPIGKAFVKPPRASSDYLVPEVGADNDSFILDPERKFQIVTNHLRHDPGLWAIEVRPNRRLSSIKTSDAEFLSVGYSSKYPAIPGHSGSAVVDDEGHIVAVVSTTIVEQLPNSKYRFRKLPDGGFQFHGPSVDHVRGLYEKFMEYKKGNPNTKIQIVKKSAASSNKLHTPSP